MGYTRISKSTETKRMLVFAKGWESGTQNGEELLDRCGFFFWKFLKVPRQQIVFLHMEWGNVLELDRNDNV